MLEPEIEEGNIEYKLLINDDNERHQGLASQMKWRLDEGNGICYYLIGVNDNGSIPKNNFDNLINSLKNLNKICKICKSKIFNVERIDNSDNEYLKVTISYDITTHKDELKVAFMGDSGLGKTTLCGLLKCGTNMDIKKAQNNIFIHKHEYKSRKTSSLT